MSDVFIRLRLLNRQFGANVRKARGDLSGFGAHARKISQSVARATGRALDRISTPTAVLGTLGVGAASRGLVDFERRLRALQVNGDASYRQIEELRQSLRDLSGASTGQLAEELLGAAEILIAKDSSLTGTLLDTDLLQQIGRVASATGADISAVAETAYQLHNAFQIPWSEVSDGLAVTVALGKEGAFELRDMSEHLPEIAASMQRIGQTGTEGLSRAAAMLQVIRSRTGSAATAATNLENVLGYIGGPQAERRLRQQGIRVFDKDGSMRDLFVILEELRKATNGGQNTRIIGQIFTDKQAREGVAALLMDFERLQDLSSRTNAGAIVDSDFADVSNTAAAAIKNLKAAVATLADQRLTPWIDRLTSLVRYLADNPGLLDKAFSVGAAIVGIATVRRMLRGMGMLGGGGGGAGGGLGGLPIPGLGGGGLPVQVTNWPGSLGGGGTDLLTKDVGAKASLLRRLLAGAGLAGTGLLSKLGLGGLATTLGGTVAGAGGLVVGGTVGAGAAIGGGIGTGINWLLPDGFKEGMQNAMAYALAPFSEDARDLVYQLRSEAEARRILQLELSSDSLTLDLARG